MEPKRRVLNLRITEHQQVAYARAAALDGTTVSALVASAADAKAEELIRTHSSITLAADDFDALLAGLEGDIELAPSLRKAFDKPRYRNR